jgi:hypothetical protein
MATTNKEDIIIPKVKAVVVVIPVVTPTTAVAITLLPTATALPAFEPACRAIWARIGFDMRFDAVPPPPPPPFDIM